jgi:hypothetical protein
MTGRMSGGEIDQNKPLHTDIGITVPVKKMAEWYISLKQEHAEFEHNGVKGMIYTEAGLGGPHIALVNYRRQWYGIDAHDLVEAILEKVESNENVRD